MQNSPDCIIPLIYNLLWILFLPQFKLLGEAVKTLADVTTKPFSDINKRTSPLNSCSL